MELEFVRVRGGMACRTPAVLSLGFSLKTSGFPWNER